MLLVVFITLVCKVKNTCEIKVAQKRNIGLESFGYNDNVIHFIVSNDPWLDFTDKSNIEGFMITMKKYRN